MRVDKDKKLSYQMVSPGEAWNNFVNSKDGHNAAAVTPSYLDNTKDKQAIPTLNSKSNSKEFPDMFTGTINQQQVTAKENVKEQPGATTQSQQKEIYPDFFSAKTQSPGAVEKDQTKTAEKAIEREK